MARQAAKVSIPVDRDEIRAAVPSARSEELLEPCEARLRARHGRGAQLHALRLQRLDFADPCLSRKVGGDVAAASGGGAVGFVEGEDVGDVGPSGDLGLDGGEEGGVCGVIGGAEEHGDELEIGGVREVGGGLGTIVVVPGQVGAGGVPDVVILRVVGVGHVDETSFGGRCDLREGGREDGEGAEYYCRAHDADVVRRLRIRRALTGVRGPV